jgi:hypothetical protein
MGGLQGCVLSPFLFSLFTHDCVATHYSNSIVFADSAAVVGLITDSEVAAYREEVRDLTSWCPDNSFTFNISKTKELIVDDRRNRGEHTPIHMTRMTHMTRTVMKRA